MTETVRPRYRTMPRSVEERKVRRCWTSSDSVAGLVAKARAWAVRLPSFFRKRAL